MSTALNDKLKAGFRSLIRLGCSCWKVGLQTLALVGALYFSLTVLINLEKYLNCHSFVRGTPLSLQEETKEKKWVGEELFMRPDTLEGKTNCDLLYISLTINNETQC